MRMLLIPTRTLTCCSIVIHQLALYIGCHGSDGLWQITEETDCIAVELPNVVCRVNPGIQSLVNDDESCDNPPESFSIPLSRQSDVKAPTLDLQQLPSGNVQVNIKPQAEAWDRNELLGYTVMFTEDVYSTPGYSPFKSSRPILCIYLMVNVTSATVEEIKRAEFRFILDRDTLNIGQSYEAQVERHPGKRRSNIVMYNHKDPVADAFWDAFWTHAHPSFVVGISTIDVSLRNPWNISPFSGKIPTHWLCLSDYSGNYVFDVFGIKVTRINLTEEGITPNENELDRLTHSFSNLIPGDYVVQVLQSWGGHKFKAINLESLRVQGWSNNDDMLWYEYIAVSLPKSTRQLQITVGVPPHIYLLESHCLIQIADDNGSIIQTTYQRVEADQFEWKNVSFSIRDNLEPGDYSVTVLPSGLDGLCPSSPDRIVETVNPCNYNATCAPCFSWKSSFSISSLHLSNRSAHQTITPKELSIVVVTLVTVLLFTAAVTIFILRRKHKCSSTRDLMVNKDNFVILGSGLDEMEAPRQIQENPLVKDGVSLITGYTFGPEFGVISSLNERVCLAHVGAPAAECLPGTETPNRGNTQAIGDLLATILEKHMGIEVVKYDSKVAVSVRSSLPHFVLITLTDELNQLYRKHILGEEIYCEAQNDELSTLDLLGSRTLGRSSIPVFLSFEHVTPHPGLFLYCDQEQPIIYSVPSQIPSLMSYLGGGLTSDHHAGVNSYLKSQDCVEIERLISQCRKAADINLQRAMEHHAWEEYRRAMSVQTAPTSFGFLPESQPSEEGLHSIRMVHSSPDLLNLYHTHNTIKSRTRSLSFLESTSRDTGRGSSVGSPRVGSPSVGSPSVGSPRTDITSYESSLQYECSEASLTTGYDSQYSSVLQETNLTV